ncbi:cyclophilin-like fold protein [uncultured Oscillibacter sp.]|uniref:cyclophilin-like fold protein n=1 Tax=uncultured Oscillibacter sp. TaxID=876091 RepID=UPI0025EE97A5|nr:cyclophilin-like fold protein [uncultured Oscillibacter sp.]
MPDTFDPDVGDLRLYAPWGSLCIFYRDFRNSTSLILLGRIDSGMDVVGGMTENFTVKMEAVK